MPIGPQKGEPLHVAVALVPVLMLVLSRAETDPAGLVGEILLDERVVAATVREQLRPEHQNLVTQAPRRSRQLPVRGAHGPLGGLEVRHGLLRLGPALVGRVAVPGPSRLLC